MDFSRPLLLKGLGGLAAVGTVGGGVVFGGNMLLKNQEEKDKAREEVNVKLKTLGLGEDCRLGKEDDPYTINKECELDEEKLKAIKFSNKGDGDLVVKSSSGTFPEGLKIKFERKNKEEDISFSFTGLAEGSDIKIFGDESKGKIILKSSTPEQKFKEERGMLEKDSSGVEDSLKSKLKEFNEKLGTVKAPIECRFDEAEKEESVECPITQEGLKGLKFSGVGEGELTVKGQVPEGLKLKVDRDAQNEMSLSFTGLSQNLTIYGDSTKGKIIVKNSGENIKKFKVKDGKLTKGDSDETLKKFNDQLVKVNAPVECRFDETESEESIECSISQDQLKGLKFSNKEEGELKIVGWNGNTNVKLKAEKNSASQNEMSVSFTGVTSDIKLFGDKSKGKIIIKSDAGENNKKFKVEGDKLTKENPDAELKKFNGQLEKVNAPLECRFDEAETEESVECDVTSKEQLKEMKFTSKEEVTYAQGEGFQNMKLLLRFNVEDKKEAGTTEAKVFYLTFKDYTETVKLTYKEGKKDKNVSLVKGTNPEFGIHDESDKGNENTKHPYLLKEWEPDDFEKLLGLSCTLPEGATQADCKFVEEEGEKKIKVAKGTEGEFVELTVDDTNGNKFVLHKDQENYNQGYKFVFSGSQVSGTGGVTLENNGEYEFKWKIQEKAKVGYLVKKKP